MRLSGPLKLVLIAPALPTPHSIHDVLFTVYLDGGNSALVIGF